MEKQNLRVGIDVNGVLRDTITKIEQTYQKFMIDKTEGIEDEDDFEYKITQPINTSDLKNHFSFRNDEELFSFLYEEFPMEIFGHAPSREYSSTPSGPGAPLKCSLNVNGTTLWDVAQFPATMLSEKTP